MFIYKTAKFAPVWSTILKIGATSVHQTLTEHSLFREYSPAARVLHAKFDQAWDVIFMAPE